MDNSSVTRAVITGVGVVAPNGIGRDAFWQTLKEGRSGVSPITVFDPGLFKAHQAGEVADFDAESFLGEKGLRNLDRSTRFLCAAAKMSLEDAGFTVKTDDLSEVGVVTATTLSAIWNIAEFSKETVVDGPQFVNPAIFPSTTMNAPSSQVSIWFKIKGFNTTISTGYTASLDALKYAVDFIKFNRAKAILVAGVEGLSFQSFVGFHKIGFLAGINGQELSCPFDKRRNGIILGEGAGVLVIEEEEAARKRGARIYAKIDSVENCFDAYRSGKYHPYAEGLKNSMNLALKKSGLDKDKITYINAAANSVPLQDKLESFAIKEVFGAAAQNLAVTSIKSMLGESFSAAGILQLIAAIGSITQNFIPPTINYLEFDPDCDLDYVTEGSRSVKVDSVLINNFGPGGNNASAIISRYNHI
ncbi:MAG: beta-ketoacyl-[acyl-carrier-protein] synthase family protein [Candidatus Omnitrophica bacterium]|nr:beta-ketoacyl-[acyl-carrier-protein] synthase family protein [Candidatus Omnitrophota bacterium]